MKKETFFDRALWYWKQFGMEHPLLLVGSWRDECFCEAALIQRYDGHTSRFMLHVEGQQIE